MAPVAYTSRRLRPEERNYHANEREALAVVHALRVWKTYLFKHLQLQTDIPSEQETPTKMVTILLVFFLSLRQLQSRYCELSSVVPGSVGLRDTRVVTVKGTPRRSAILITVV